MHIKGWMKMFYYINLFSKCFSPDVLHHGECSNNPLALTTRLLSHNQPISKSFKICSKCYQFSVLTPTPTQPSLNHHHLWPKQDFSNVNLLCHSHVQNSPVASITDKIQRHPPLLITPHSPQATQAAILPVMYQSTHLCYFFSISVSSRHLKG